MNTTRSATLRAKPISWVTSIMVMPSAAISSSVFSTSPTSSGSSAEVISSNSIRVGCMASDRAIATRCCWPPESWSGQASIFSARPTLASTRSASARASPGETPFTTLGASVMFFSTVRWGNRLKLWNTMPTCWRSLRRSVAGSFTTVPSNETVPPWIGSSPLTQRKRVLLPEPERPMMAMISPLSTASDTPFSTVWLP